MTVDRRGRDAARRMQATVDSAPLRLFEAGRAGPAPARPPAVRPSLVSFAGAFLVVLALVGFLVGQRTWFAPDRAEVVDTTPSSLPQPPPIIIPDGPVVTTVPPATSPTRHHDPTTTVAVDVLPPPLTISSPTEGERFEEPKLRFAGSTEPGATVMAGPYRAEVDAAGNWDIVLILSPGANRATITATDAAGNQAAATVTVYYDPPVVTTEPRPKPEPPPPTTVVEEPPAVEFSAYATYGSCELDPPYDVYYGTAQPGSKVTITSEYGSATVVAGSEGGWEKKVLFEAAPHGVVFAVTVSDGLGNSRTFEFVSYAGEA